jgi:membrane protein required for beta-lactamase induction
MPQPPAPDVWVKSYTRPVKVHDLIVVTVTNVFFVLITILLQIIVVTKATIPADEVITEIRILRSEQAQQNKDVAQRLAEIETLIDVNKIRRETLQQLNIPDGNSAD